MKQLIEMPNDVIYHTVESYAVFKNVDKTILATNCFLEKFGYKFVCFNLEELEKNFSALLSLPKKFESEHQICFQDNNFSISNEFCQALMHNHEFGMPSIISKEVIFLKAINDFEQAVVNNIVNMELADTHLGKMQSFVEVLIQQFRLFKNGCISCTSQFQIRKDERNIPIKLWGPIGKSLSHSTFTLTESEVEILGTLFKDNFTSNELTELAISNFNLSYDIADIKTKYITLMTCLESLFNQGRDQITHTVSRHLALILSKSDEEFQKNYYRNKVLYNLRSAIVHGNQTNEDLSAATDELQNKVRQAINFCLHLSDNKKQLFDKLNAMGFDTTMKKKGLWRFIIPRCIGK